MCGIIGYTGKTSALPILLDGIKRLEYRGYDSAGITVLDGSGATRLRAPGRISELEALLPPLEERMARAKAGIAHTRWATHGAPTEKNAHPHTDCTGTIFIAHNGIIENYRELRNFLTTHGHILSSETDTETLAHLIEHEARAGVPLEEAAASALRQVKGTFGLVIMSQQEPTKIVAARRSSPLLLGIGKGEHFVASDASALVQYTREVVYLNDDELAVLTPQSYILRSLDGQTVTTQPETIDWSVDQISKHGYATFMEKEIFEGPEAVTNALRGRLINSEGRVKLGGLEAVEERLRTIQRLVIVSCGTSYYAGLVGGLMLEEYAKLPVTVLQASEFRYRDMPFDHDTVVLAISQSGETADTLAAVKEAKRRGLLTLGLVNVVGSSIARATEAGVYNHAGPEIGVASTKAFVSQLALLGLLTVHLGRMRSMPLAVGNRIIQELSNLPELMRSVLKQADDIKILAERYASFENFLYIGRKYNYPTALEGALKLKEISYVHAEGHPGGELKHGPIALISNRFPTVAIAPTDSVYEKMISNIEEVRARGGAVLAIGTAGNTNLQSICSDVCFVPKTLEMLSPILTVLPLQLFAYYLATTLGRDVDKPRNLAKSVTVE